MLHKESYENGIDAKEYNQVMLEIAVLDGTLNPVDYLSITLEQYNNFSRAAQAQFVEYTKVLVEFANVDYTDFTFYNERDAQDKNWEYVKEGRSERGSTVVLIIAAIALIAAAAVAVAPTGAAAVIIRDVAQTLAGL